MRVGGYVAACLLLKLVKDQILDYTNLCGRTSEYKVKFRLLTKCIGRVSKNFYSFLILEHFVVILKRVILVTEESFFKKDDLLIVLRVVKVDVHVKIATDQIVSSLNLDLNQQ